MLIDAGLLRNAETPDDLAVQRHLGYFAILDVAYVEEFLLAFLADCQAVAAAVEFLAEGADELAVLIEDGNGVHRILGGRLVREIDQPLLVEDHAVRIAPMDMPGERAPIVGGLIGIVPRTQHRLSAARLISRMDERGPIAAVAPAARRRLGTGDGRFLRRRRPFLAWT